MAQMIRKEIELTLEQAARLRRLAHSLGLSEAEVIQRGIERLDADQTRGGDDQARQGALAFMRERAKLPSAGGARGWTREALYEERLNRISRRH